MCGIVGATWAQLPGGGGAEAVDDMARALAHRGPDDHGTWADDGIALGHRRLAVIDLTPGGHQPMQSRSGRWVVVYNGEIYNHHEVRSQLPDPRGLRSTSDTEVLVEAVDAWGLEGALSRVNGMFAFGLWDRQERRLSLVRDRMGEKPLYYGWFGGALVFGSELKALRRWPGFNAQVDPDVVALYLRHAYVPAPYSIYRGVSKVPAGGVVTVDPARPGAVDVRQYWSVRQAADSGLGGTWRGSDGEAVDELERLLRDSVAQRLVADVPVGAFLSGGIDSSTVVALMQAQSATPVQTFTIGFDETGYDEAQHAAAVARHLGTDHTELYVTPADALAVVPKLPLMYDEPFADPSQIPTHLVSELAQRAVKVALSGDGGDELFGGYTRYTFHRRVWGTIGRVPAPVRTVGARVIRGVPPARWDVMSRALGPVLPARVPRARLGEKLHKGAAMLAARDPEQVYRPLLTHWSDPSSVVLGAQEHADAAVDRSRWAALSDATERMMFLDSISYLPDDILVKVDRAAMATSLETRVPLLAPEVVEFAWSVPLDVKIRAGDGKWPLRQVLHRYVPRELVERPKMGFGVPVGEWVRGPLREWAEDLLDPQAMTSGGLLEPAVVARTWEEHKRGERDWSYPVWNVLMLLAWQREARREATTASEETHA